MPVDTLPNSQYVHNMNRRATHKAARRGAIVRAASELLRDGGAADATVERAMGRAGLTVGAFYAHFASKGELVDHAFDQAMAEIGELIAAVAAGRSGKEALSAVVDTYLGVWHRDHPTMGCVLPGLALAAPGLDHQVDTLLTRGFATMVERLVALSGGLLTGDDARALAVLMVGGQRLARATRESEISAQILNACRDAADRLLGRAHVSQPTHHPLLESVLTNGDAR